MTEQELQDLERMVEVAVNALEDIKGKDIYQWRQHAPSESIGQ